MNKLKDTLSQYWLTIQGTLAPKLKEDLDEFLVQQQQLITVLALGSLSGNASHKGNHKELPI